MDPIDKLKLHVKNFGAIELQDNNHKDNYIPIEGIRRRLNKKGNSYQVYGYRNGKQIIRGTFYNLNDALKERDKFRHEN